MTADGRMNESIWPKIADFMIQHRLNPVQCIWYAFEKRKVGHAPLPNQIALPKYITKYRSLSKRMREEVVVSFEAEKQRFVRCLTLMADSYGTGKQAWAYALLDDSHGCSALFRYCLAVSEKLDIVVEEYEYTATMQYLTSPDLYDETWGEWIPEALKEQGSCL